MSIKYARMVELVDTRDLKSLGLTVVRVQVPLCAPKQDDDPRGRLIVLVYSGLEPWSKTASGCLSYHCLTDEIALAIRGV